MEYFTEAIVLGKSDVKDYDRQFLLYTRHLGKTAVLARGVRRVQSKMAGHLEPFALLKVKLVTGRGQIKLSNVETVKRYQYILGDLELINLARESLHLVDILVKEDSCDFGILKFLTWLLSSLDNPSLTLPEKKFLTKIFIWQLISHLGYQPELYNCVICRQAIIPVENNFSPRRGGLVCRDCYSGIAHEDDVLTASKDEIKILRLLLSEPAEFFVDKKIDQVLVGGTSKIIDQFARYHRADLTSSSFLAKVKI